MICLKLKDPYFSGRDSNQNEMISIKLFNILSFYHLILKNKEEFEHISFNIFFSQEDRYTRLGFKIESQKL